MPRPCEVVDCRPTGWCNFTVPEAPHGISFPSVPCHPEVRRRRWQVNFIGSPIRRFARSEIGPRALTNEMTSGSLADSGEKGKKEREFAESNIEGAKRKTRRVSRLPLLPFTLFRPVFIYRNISASGVKLARRMKIAPGNFARCAIRQFRIDFCLVIAYVYMNKVTR